MRRVFQYKFAALASCARFYGTRHYTESHEWVEHQDGIATIGISNHAQESLGDVVYIALPNVGDKVEAKEIFGEVESVKATSNVYSPVSGIVESTNEKVRDEPAIINRSAETDGWLLKVKCTEVPSGLMTAEEYKKFIE